MIALAVVIGLLLMAAGMRLAGPALRQLRVRSELRGDWWSRFERELRDYERVRRLTARQRPS